MRSAIPTFLVSKPRETGTLSGQELQSPSALDEGEREEGRQQKQGRSGDGGEAKLSVEGFDLQSAMWSIAFLCGSILLLPSTAGTPATL